jgi:hypothetical protein
MQDVQVELNPHNAELYALDLLTTRINCLNTRQMVKACSTYEGEVRLLVGKREER